MNYHMITYNNDPNNYDLVQVIKQDGDITLTKVMASSIKNYRKYQAFSSTTWKRTKSVEPQLLPTFIGAPFVSDEFAAKIKEMYSS